jgi:hypothetical protein
MSASYGSINTTKTNFEEIYVKEDPRAYFSVLGALDYMIPDVAAPVVRQILEAYRRRYDRRPVVLDVGSSYGINAAVHRFPVTFASLRRRYAGHEMAALEPKEVARLDRNYYASWPDTGVGTFVGLDASEPAIRYAEDVGLIERGIAADLETAPLSRDSQNLVGNVDVVLSTGAVGYVSDKTFRTVLEAASRPLWIVSFVLRMFPYDTLQAMFAKHGLVTEHLDSALFVQRRFSDLAEFERCRDQLAGRGVDSSRLESDGLLHADLFVSRPAKDIEDARLEDIVTISVGRNRPTGTRYVYVPTDEGQQVALEP